MLLLPSLLTLATLQTPLVPSASGGWTGFLENRGQWDCEVLFHGQCGGNWLTVCRDGVHLRGEVLEGRDEAPVLRISTGEEIGIGRAVGGSARQTRHHFIQGSGTTRDVLAFEEVRIDEVRPGVDMVWRASSMGFAYDIILEPGASLDELTISIDGADRIEALDLSSLLVEVDGHVALQTTGACWMEDRWEGARSPIEVSVASSSVAGGSHALSFSSTGDAEDRTRVIDPGLGFCTYIGGTDPLNGSIVGSEFAPDGEVFITSVNSLGAPTTPGALQTTTMNLVDGWIGKLSSDGRNLEWATFIGGDNTDVVEDVALRPGGDVAIGGWTLSADFPTTPGAYLETNPSPGKGTAFAAVLEPDGTALIWSTFYGNSFSQISEVIDVDQQGRIVLGVDFVSGVMPPATTGAFDEVFDPEKWLLAKLSADGSQLEWATYFPMGIRELDHDSAGNLVLVGNQAGAIPFPTTPQAFLKSQSTQGLVALSKLSADGSALLWSTFIGNEVGFSGATARGMLVLEDDTVVIGAGGTSDGWPVTPGAFSSPVPSGSITGNAARVLSDGSDLVWSSLLGGCCFAAQSFKAISADRSGQVWGVGSSIISGWPVTPDAFQPSFLGPGFIPDAVITKFGMFGETLEYSTYFGGFDAGESAFGVGVDSLGRPRVAMTSDGGGLPTQPWVYQPVDSGFSSYAVAAFDIPAKPWLLLGGGSSAICSSPNLAAAGDQLPGSATRFALRGAKPLAPVWLVAGGSRIDLPILGGVLIPTPGPLFSGFTNDAGSFDWNLPWPTQTLNVDLWFQAWCFDADMPGLFSWTNGMQALVVSG